jgi:uncharacterized Zn finger protein
MEKFQKAGRAVSAVVIEGRSIARTFWGKAWCDNLERYSDYANRLPRGRTYVRNGSVVDLQISPGAINAYVSGSELYKVELKVAPLKPARWKSICNDCAGSIDSLVELLQGRLSKGVMERICRKEQGLFPSPAEIQLSCSCPDWASMCKHVAAALYGIGARFDHQPELLFRLRQVDETELLASAGKATPLARSGPDAGKLLAAEDLAGMFGLDMAPDATSEPEPPPRKPAKPAKAKQAPKPKTKQRPKKKAAKKAARKQPPAARKQKRQPAE